MNEELDLFKNVSYRYLLIPDYGPNESRIILVGHQAFCDGMSLWSMFAAMSRDFSILPKMPELTMGKKLMNELLLPLSMPERSITNRQFSKTRHSILRGDSPSEKYIKIIEGIPLKNILTQCKRFKATFNEVIQAVLSQTIKEYFVRDGDSETSGIVFCSTYSLKDFDRSMETLSMGNNWVPILSNMGIREKFEDALEQTKLISKALMQSRHIAASRALIEIETSLHFGLNNKVNDEKSA